MKVLFYNHTGRVSGAENVLLLALQHLDRKVIDARVVCPRGDLSDAVGRLDMPVGNIGELKARFTVSPYRLVLYAASLFQTVLALRREIRAFKAEVVHANSPRAGIAAIFATMGSSLPVIWHLHDEMIPHPITSLIRLLAARSRRCSIIAVSEATALTFANGSSTLKESIRVIHNAVDIRAIDDTAPVLIREELNLKASDFLFGIVGQITPRKRQLELVNTFANIADEMPFAKLLVIGSAVFNKDAVYQEETVRLTRELDITDRVIFLGHRTDVIGIIKELDTLVINSSSEAFVMVGIEAMACRTAVVATDVGGTREMITDGFNGRLIPAEDDEALRSALLNMYGAKELRELFVARSREKAEKELNVDRFASEFHQALFVAAAAASYAAGSTHEQIKAIENQ